MSATNSHMLAKAAADFLRSAATIDVSQEGFARQVAAVPPIGGGTLPYFLGRFGFQSPMVAVSVGPLGVSAGGAVADILEGQLEVTVIHQEPRAILPETLWANLATWSQAVVSVLHRSRLALPSQVIACSWIETSPPLAYEAGAGKPPFLSQTARFKMLCLP